MYAITCLMISMSLLLPSCMYAAAEPTLTLYDFAPYLVAAKKIGDHSTIMCGQVCLVPNTAEKLVILTSRSCDIGQALEAHTLSVNARCTHEDIEKLLALTDDTATEALYGYVTGERMLVGHKGVAFRALAIKKDDTPAEQLTKHATRFVATRLSYMRHYQAIVFVRTSMLDDATINDTVKQLVRQGALPSDIVTALVQADTTDTAAVAYLDCALLQNAEVMSEPAETSLVVIRQRANNKRSCCNLL